MKEILEKIVVDSAGKIATEVANEVTNQAMHAINNVTNGFSQNQTITPSNHSPQNRSQIFSDHSAIQSAIQSDDQSIQPQRISAFSSQLNSSGMQNNVPDSLNISAVTPPITHNIGVINAYSKNKRLNLMVIGAALGLVFCLLVLTTYKGDLPGEVVGIISTVSGIFGACLKDAYSFEFGSSRGSKEKDDRISSAILERLKVK